MVCISHAVPSSLLNEIPYLIQKMYDLHQKVAKLR